MTATSKQKTVPFRVSYRDAVDFLARSNEVGALDEDVVQGFASVGLIAIIFGVNVQQVARDVVRVCEAGQTLHERRFIARLKGRRVKKRPRAWKSPASARRARRVR